VWSAGGPEGPDDDRYIALLQKVQAAGVKHYWIGAGTTDFALNGSKNLSAVAQKAELNTTFHTAPGAHYCFHTAPGAHYWFIWRQFLGEFGAVIFR
jgi:hypothetical protein